MTKKHEVKNLADYEFKTYKMGGAELEAGFYSTDELRDLVKGLDRMNAATARSMEQDRQEARRLQQEAWNIDSKYARLLALTLECMILDPQRWHDDAVKVLNQYRAEWDKLNPSPSPFGKD